MLIDWLIVGWVGWVIGHSRRHAVVAILLFAERSSVLFLCCYYGKWHYGSW